MKVFITIVMAVSFFSLDGYANQIELNCELEVSYRGNPTLHHASFGYTAVECNDDVPCGFEVKRAEVADTCVLFGGYTYDGKNYININFSTCDNYHIYKALSPKTSDEFSVGAELEKDLIWINCSKV